MKRELFPYEVQLCQIILMAPETNLLVSEDGSTKDIEYEDI